MLLMDAQVSGRVVLSYSLLLGALKPARDPQCTWVLPPSFATSRLGTQAFVLFYRLAGRSPAWGFLSQMRGVRAQRQLDY